MTLTSSLWLDLAEAANHCREGRESKWWYEEICKFENHCRCFPYKNSSVRASTLCACQHFWVTNSDTSTYMPFCLREVMCQVSHGERKQPTHMVYMVGRIQPGPRILVFHCDLCRHALRGRESLGAINCHLKVAPPLAVAMLTTYWSQPYFFRHW